MKPYFTDSAVTLHHGDCLEVLRELADSSVDSVVTDPPYGLGFMGKAWDDLPPGEKWARECLRVLKPGGHLLAFGGSRTWHRLAVAVEDAGFEIRDSIAWLYGSGFPKSLDVSKAIDKAAGAERRVIGPPPGIGNRDPQKPAQQWQGWGTALKPAFEPIVVGRKPFPGTVAANVQENSTGALNIDACRIPGSSENARASKGTGLGYHGADGERGAWTGDTGRWPTNVVLDESQAAALDAQTGILRTGGNENGTSPSAPTTDVYGEYQRKPYEKIRDSGGASRYFPVFRYQAKAPARERPKVDGVAHPTVKPLEFMRWLVRLVTPPDGLVLDTFAGSGTTGEACLLEGFRCILIERDAEYLPLILHRLSKPLAPVLDAAGGV